MEPADVPVQRRTPRDVGMANMVAAARALLDDRPPEEITVRDIAAASGHHHRFVVDQKSTEARLAAKAQKAGLAPVGA